MSIHTKFEELVHEIGYREALTHIEFEFWQRRKHIGNVKLAAETGLYESSVRLKLLRYGFREPTRINHQKSLYQQEIGDELPILTDSPPG